MSEYIIDMSSSSYQSESGLLCADVSQLREEIVRCRDCAYICNREYANGLECHTCSYFDSEHAEVKPDGFCAWAERRES